MLAHLGIAKKGPIVKYNKQVKNKAYGLPILDDMSNNPVDLEMPSAVTPKSGNPTPVSKNPTIATKIFLPAI